MSLAGKSKNLLEMLGELTPMKITKWATTSNANEQETEDDREPAEFFDGANVVTSQRKDASRWFRSRHAVLLDLDVPAYLVPSTTPGHSHLYIDVDCREEDYFAFLDAAAKIGVIESGYAKASKKKGATYLRLPWVKKYDPLPF